MPRICNHKRQIKKKTSIENGSEIYGVLNKDWVMILKELLSKKKAKDKDIFHLNLLIQKKSISIFIYLKINLININSLLILY